MKAFFELVRRSLFSLVQTPKKDSISRHEMTLEEVFASQESNFKFRLLGAFHSGIARQQKWVIDFMTPEELESQVEQEAKSPSD